MTDGLCLVGDIGGTNARFALVDPHSSVDGVRYELQDLRILPCSDFENLDAAVKAYLEVSSVSEVSQACMAFACPVHGDEITMTNNHWAFNKAEMQSVLGLQSFKIVNDFTAMALGVPHVESSGLVKIGGGAEQESRPKLVIGPGTGLGVSGLVRTQHAWLPLSTEGGHVDFAPTNEMEVKILHLLRGRFGRVSVERILCGEGLVNLYQCLSVIEGVDPVYLEPAQITAAALIKEDLCAVKTLQVFCEIFGRVAGNAALTIGALGGVYVCGGVIPRILAFFKLSAFRDCFEDKGRMRSYLQDVPVFVVTGPYTGLLGAAEALNNIEVR